MESGKFQKNFRTFQIPSNKGDDKKDSDKKNVSSSNDTKKSTKTEDDTDEEIEGQSYRYIYDHTHTVPSATTHRSNSSSTGMDLNDAECVENEQQSQDSSAASPEDDYKDEVDDDPDTDSLAKDDMRDYEEAQRERMGLMENAESIADEAVDPSSKKHPEIRATLTKGNSSDVRRIIAHLSVSRCCTYAC